MPFFLLENHEQNRGCGGVVILRADSAGFEFFSFCSFTVGTCIDAFVGCLLDLLCIYTQILNKVIVRQIREALTIHTFFYVLSGIHTDTARSISDRSSFQPDYLLTTLIVVLLIEFQNTFMQVMRFFYFSVSVFAPVSGQPYVMDSVALAGSITFFLFPRGIHAQVSF